MTEEVVEQKRGLVLLALMLTMALAAMDITIVSTAIPQIVSDLGGFTKFSWVFSSYLLAQTITIPVYGKLTDIFGRKHILIFGIIVFLVGSLASAIAWDITALIIFRGVQGLGAGAMMATVNTIAGDIYTIRERAKVQGYLSSIWGISAIIGPALGGALTEYINWRWIFLINLPIGAVSIFFITAYFKEKITPVSPHIDYKGASLILVTLSLLFLYLLEGGQSWSWWSVQSFVLLASVMGFAGWTVWVEKKSENAMMPLWIWKNPTLAFNNLAMVGMGIVMMGPETFLPTFAQSSLNLGIIASGFVLASMSIGWPVASSLSGGLYMKYGFRETAILGAILVLVSCSGFLLIPKPQPVYLIVLDQVLLGAGFGFLSTPTLVGIQSMVGWKHRGVVTGVNMFSRNLGQSLGAAVMGSIFNNSLLQQMENAPSGLVSSSKDIIKVLHSPDVAESSKNFIRDAINVSMHHIYWGLVIFTVMIMAWLYLIPKRDPKDESLIME